MEYIIETINTCAKAIRFTLKGNVVTNCADQLARAVRKAYEESMQLA